MWEEGGGGGGEVIPTKIIVDVHVDSYDQSYKFWGVHGGFYYFLLSLCSRVHQTKYALEGLNVYTISVLHLSTA